MIQPQVREAQPLIIQADVMREEMTSCCEVEYTGKSIPLLLHQVRCFCRSLSVHKGCYIGEHWHTTPGKKESTDECPRFLVTPFLPTIRDKIFATKIQYCASGAPLKLLHVYYNHTTYVLHTNQEPLCDSYTLLTNVKDKDKPEDRQGAVYKIKKTTVSLDILFTCQIPSKGS